VAPGPVRTFSSAAAAALSRASCARFRYWDGRLFLTEVTGPLISRRLLRGLLSNSLLPCQSRRLPRLSRRLGLADNREHQGFTLPKP
jgi:hypothetical protein